MGAAIARRRGLSHSPLAAPLRVSSGREHRVYRFAKFRYQHRLLQHRPVTELFRSARWPVAADKEKRQIAPGDNLGDRADDATGNIYVENGEIKNRGLCQSLPNF